MRLVDIEPFEKQGHGCLMYVTEGGSLVQTITSALPTVDAEEARHGRWIPVSNTGIGATGRCTACNKAIYGFVAYNYCPNCGAKMDLEVSYV